MEKYQVVKMHTFLHKDPCFEVCVCVSVCFLLCWSTTETGHLHTNLEQELLDGIKVEACGKNMHKTGVIAETLRIWQS